MFTNSKINQQTNHQTNQQLTNNQPTTNHKQESQEVKKVKNKRIERVFVPPSGDHLQQNGHQWVDAKAWDDFIQHRLEIKKPLSALAVKKTLDLLTQYPQRQREIIDETIRNRWTGVFKPKGKPITEDTGPRYRTLEAPND